ncbi:MAG: ribonuclease J [Acidobacteria bacterium]|nr:ribonuclease J [Acidobacteriota bacterium]
MSEPKLQVTPLGGLGEFGMNCHAIRYGDDILVVDAGMMFPEDELMGVDSVIPDFSYLTSNKEHVRAVIFTHGHEDHIGAAPFLLSEIDVPVYATPFTRSLIERRLEEHDMVEHVNLNSVLPGETVKVGPFSIEFIHVTHSIVQAVALAIATPLGVIIHTGDFKVDPTPTDNEPFNLHAFAEYGKRGVLLLMSDSTNSDRPGNTPSERAVRPRLEDIFHRTRHRLIVSCFSSSIHRVQQLLDLARQHGRKVAFLGRSMTEVTTIAHNLDLLQIPDDTLLRPQDIQSARRERVLVIVSGTQGEPMSALSRVAVDNHKHLSIDPGDTVVLSARIIPGNEKPIYRMMNHMAKRGADLIYGSMTPPVHVSGHASSEELHLILNLVRPRFFLPIHGEYRQLAVHAQLAERCAVGLERTFVIETGQTLVIDEYGARRGEDVQVGRVCIDSGTIDEFVDDIVIRDRRHLAEDGFVLPIVAINKHTGLPEALPEIVSRGFISDDGASEVLQEARRVVLKTIEGSSVEERGDWGVMQEKIRADLKRHISKQTQRRPLIMPVILEV